MAIHQKYLELNPTELALCDEILRDAFAKIRNVPSYSGIRLIGDDRAERVAEAIATWIVSSR